jgi:hypothetical protein
METRGTTRDARRAPLRPRRPSLRPVCFVLLSVPPGGRREGGVYQRFRRARGDDGETRSRLGSTARENTKTESRVVSDDAAFYSHFGARAEREYLIFIPVAADGTDPRLLIRRRGPSGPSDPSGPSGPSGPSDRLRAAVFVLELLVFPPRFVLWRASLGASSTAVHDVRGGDDEDDAGRPLRREPSRRREPTAITRRRFPPRWIPRTRRTRPRETRPRPRRCASALLRGTPRGVLRREPETRSSVEKSNSQSARVVGGESSAEHRVGRGGVARDIQIHRRVEPREALG